MRGREIRKPTIEPWGTPALTMEIEKKGPFLEMTDETFIYKFFKVFI